MIDYVEYQTPEMTHNLGRLGYNLLGKEDIMAPKPEISPQQPIEYAGPELTTEESIIKVLKEHPDPRYIKGLPVIISKNMIDYDALVNLVHQHNHEDLHLPNKVGFILQISRDLFSKLRIETDYEALDTAIESLDRIKNHQIAAINPYLGANPAYIKMAMERRDNRMRHWNIVGLFDKAWFMETLLLYMDEQNVQ